MKDLELFDKDGNKVSINDILSKLIPLEKVNRIEVIDQQGRSYVNWKSYNKVQISLQDDSRTLKVFITTKK